MIGRIMKDGKMVKSKEEEERSLGKEERAELTCELVKSLLRNKLVVILGDSIQRGIYKDLISLLQSDEMLIDRDLKAKGEITFLSDTLIEGGVKGAMTNGTSYTEVRQYQTPTHLVRFYFITRCYNAYVESILRDLEDGPKPDLVIMNSCLWDITRYGTSAIKEYKDNMGLLFERFIQVLPPTCLMVWNTTLPISRNARGGFLVQEIHYNNQTLRMDVLEANFFARQIVVNHGFNILDLHYWFRWRIDWRVADGIHWNTTAHRCISELLLSHVAHAWDFPFPSFDFSSSTHPLNQPSDSAVPGPLTEIATRLNGQPPSRPDRCVMVRHRPSPYPFLPHPMARRVSRYGQENGRGPACSPRHNGPVNYHSFPSQRDRPCGRDFPVTNFRSQWSPYYGDSFQGAERRRGRMGRSRHALY